MRRLVLVAVAASLLSFASLAVAAPEANHAAAVESFRRGTQLVEAGKIQDAIEAFREALRREPSSVGARLDLADCYEKIGAPASAWREYALAEVYARRADDVRRTMARSSSTALESRLLVVRFEGEPEPATIVRVDGEQVAPELMSRGAIAVTPGSHRVEIAEPGKASRIADFTGRAGETSTVVLGPGSVVPAATPASPASPAPMEQVPDRASDGSSRRTVGLVIGGVGVAGLVVGSVTGVIAASKKSSLDAEQKDPTIGAPKFYDDRASAKTMATVSTVSLVAGGAAVLAGAVLYFTAPSSSDRTAIRVYPTPGGAMLDATF